MAKLVLSLNGVVQGEYELNKERGTNGSYVNGKLVKKHALKNGDVVSIGKHELKYINEHATADDDEFEKTMIIKPGSASAAVAAAKAAEQAGAGPITPPAKPAAAPGQPTGVTP